MGRRTMRNVISILLISVLTESKGGFIIHINKPTVGLLKGKLCLEL